MVEDKSYIIVWIAIGLMFLALYYYKREFFIPDYESEKETFIKTTIDTSEDPTVLSSGAVQKYKDDKGYIYNLYFNLPEVNSPFQTQDLDKPFNAKRSFVNYRVFGEKNEGTLDDLGELLRSGNGEHILEIKSPMDYKGMYVKLGDTLVSYSKI